MMALGLRKFLIVSALAVSLGAAWAGAQESADELSLSLQDTLKVALEKNFDVRVQTLTRESADLTLKASYGMYDPLLGVNWSTAVDRQPTTNRLQVGLFQFGTYLTRQDQYNLSLQQMTPWGEGFQLTWDNSRAHTNSEYSFFDPTYSSSATLGTSLPLLKGFGVKVASQTVLQAKLDRAIADEKYAQNLRDTLLQVEKDYWNVVFAIRDLNVKQKALELAQQFQEETKKKIAVGVLAPIEQIAADAQVATREQDIITSQQAVGDAQDILKLDMGIPQGSAEWSRSIRPTDDPVVSTTEFSEAELVGKAMEKRPEIRQQVHAVEKDKLSTYNAKNATRPQLDLAASLTYNGATGYYVNPLTGEVFNETFPDAWRQITGGDYKSYYVGLTFSYPIMNRAAKYRFQTTRLAQNADEILLEKLRLSITNEVRAGLRNLLAAQKRVASAEVAFKLQKEKLDAEQKKYENGLSTSFQVLTYQNDLIAAASSLLSARIGAQVAGASLDRAVGVYLESHHIEIK
jgi:outer membrane protein